MYVTCHELYTDITYKFSATRDICMKFQILLSGKNKNITNCCPLAMVKLGQIHLICVGEYLVSMFLCISMQKKKITDPDQMLCSVTSDLSLHRLSKYTLCNIYSADNILKYVSFFFSFFQKKGFDST